MKGLRLARNVRLGVKSLMLHKLRSTLTMLGVVFGVASVIAMLAVGEGASREALTQIRKLGATNIMLSSVKPPEAQERARNTGRSMTIEYGLLYDDRERIAESHPTVIHAVGAKIVRKIARVGARVHEVRMVATAPAWFDLVRRPLLAGRVLMERDVANHAGVCVVSEEVARRLLATEYALGQLVRIGSDAYEVVGVIRTEPAVGGGIQTPDRISDVYIPLNVGRERIGDTVVNRATGSFSREKAELHQIIVQVSDTQEVEPTATAIERMLDRFHDQSDYRISVPLALLNQARQTKRIFNIVLGSIAGISLLVGGIGIMNIMLASVTERTREIGIRRAIGAKRRQIIGQFLVETVVLALVGGLAGMALGMIVPELITRFAGMPTVVTPWSVVLSLSISAATGILFGLYPAYRAASVDPIVALRHE